MCPFAEIISLEKQIRLRRLWQRQVCCVEDGTGGMEGTILVSHLRLSVLHTTNGWKDWGWVMRRSDKMMGDFIFVLKGVLRWPSVTASISIVLTDFFRPKPTPPKMFSFIADTRLLQSHFIHFNRCGYIVSPTVVMHSTNSVFISLHRRPIEMQLQRIFSFSLRFVRCANPRVAAICFMALSNLRHIATQSPRELFRVATTTFPQWQWHGVHSHAKRDKSPNAFTLSRAFW